MDGAVDGSGVGIIVGEQTGGDPSGEAVNMGWSGRHSKGQHSGHPDGNGRMSQSSLRNWELEQSSGRKGSLYGKKHDANGHWSITSTQSDGISLGTADGAGDGKGVGAPQ